MTIAVVAAIVIASATALGIQSRCGKLLPNIVLVAAVWMSCGFFAGYYMLIGQSIVSFVCIIVFTIYSLVATPLILRHLRV